MKVSALIFLSIVGVTIAVAIPVQPEGVDTQLTLADLENEQKAANYVDGLTDANGNVAREKRFILKKLALAKLAHLGFGALALGGAALATKSIFNTVLDFPSHLYRASPRLAFSYPNGAYQYSQYFR